MLVVCDSSSGLVLASDLGCLEQLKSTVSQGVRGAGADLPPAYSTASAAPQAWLPSLLLVSTFLEAHALNSQTVPSNILCYGTREVQGKKAALSSFLLPSFWLLFLETRVLNIAD